MPRLIAASTSKIRSALGDPHVQLLAVRVICNQDNVGVTRGNRNLDAHNAWDKTGAAAELAPKFILRAEPPLPSA